MFEGKDPMRLYLLLCTLLFSCLAAADSVRLASGEWPPFHGEQLPHHGVASRIVAEAFALEGIEVQWEFLPWARSLQMAAQGQRTGTAVWRRSAERDKQFFISDPVLLSHQHFFHLKNRNFAWTTLDDLQDLRIGATRSYFYGRDFERAERAGRLNVQRINSDEVAFRQLLGGRIDLFPMSRVAGLGLLAQRFTAAERARLSVDPKPLSSASLHLLLSRQVPGNAELLERFNRGLKQLQDSGKITQYLWDAQPP